MTIWDKFILSSIVDLQGNLWTGPEAIDLPFKAPVYVLTAQNPNGEKQLPETNALLHQELLSWTSKHLPGSQHREVIGKNKDGQWKELGMAYEGITLNDACTIARTFEQLAFFRLSDWTMEVVDAGGIVVRARLRRHGG